MKATTQMSILLPRQPGQRDRFLEGLVSVCSSLPEREAVGFDSTLRFLAVRV
jgi:hypothetical protein